MAKDLDFHLYSGHRSQIHRHLGPTLGRDFLIDRSTLERWLNEGAHALRSLFSLAQQYRYSGCTRDDFAAKNAAARAALEKFGELPQEVLEGTRRSKFAPPIVRRGLQQRGDGPAAAPSASDEAAATEAPEATAGEDEQA